MASLLKSSNVVSSLISKAPEKLQRYAKFGEEHVQDIVNAFKKQGTKSAVNESYKKSKSGIYFILEFLYIIALYENILSICEILYVYVTKQFEEFNKNRKIKKAKKTINSYYTQIDAKIHDSKKSVGETVDHLINGSKKSFFYELITFMYKETMKFMKFVYGTIKDGISDIIKGNFVLKIFLLNIFNGLNGFVADFYDEFDEDSIIIKIIEFIRIGIALKYIIDKLDKKND